MSAIGLSEDQGLNEPKDSEEPRANPRRLECLDGLRGVAALVVVIHHFCYAFLPIAVLETSHGRSLLGKLAPHLLALFDGPYAVCIFFVLSGFVLAKSVSRVNWALPSRLFARYLRLTVPMAVSIIYAWLLFSAFPFSRIQIQALAPNRWLRLANPGENLPSFFSALQDGIYGVYLHGSTALNNVVWTMRYELFGSVAVYLIYRFCRVPRRIPALYVFAGLSLLQPQYLGFPLGCLLKELGERDRLRVSKWNWAAVLIAIVLFLTAHPGIAHPFTIFLYSCSAGALVYGVLTLDSLGRLLGTSIPLFLGRISFALYLLHVPLIVTVGTWEYLHLGASPLLKLVLIFLEILVGTIALAWLMTIGIDEPLVKYLQRFKKLRREPASPGPSTDLEAGVPPTSSENR